MFVETPHQKDNDSVHGSRYRGNCFTADYWKLYLKLVSKGQIAAFIPLYATLLTFWSSMLFCFLCDTIVLKELLFRPLD